MKKVFSPLDPEIQSTRQKLPTKVYSFSVGHRFKITQTNHSTLIIYLTHNAHGKKTNNVIGSDHVISNVQCRMRFTLIQLFVHSIMHNAPELEILQIYVC